MYSEVEGKKITKENNKNQKNKTARMVSERANPGRKEKKRRNRNKSRDT